MVWPFDEITSTEFGGNLRFAPIVSDTIGSMNSTHSVGEAVVVGASVGELVGDSVGLSVGDVVGAYVGNSVGCEVGAFVGLLVVAFVGAIVTSW